jgi:hypothetical protein
MKPAARAMLTLLLAACPLAAGAQSLDPASLRRKQEAQEQARRMTRDLVASILDIQLRQLDENGLVELPMYRDVRAMRDHLDGLIEAEMHEVVELLVAAGRAERQQRQALFIAAREAIREIVARLAAERLSLSRRLRAAELTLRARQVIERQTIVLATTESLPIQPAQRQAENQLVALEDQRDVRELFNELDTSLREVRDWSGPLAAGAAEGLSIVEAAGVRDLLDRAQQGLQAADFAAAALSQRAAIVGLRQLLERLERAQGLVGSDRAAFAERIHDLAARQRTLEERSRQADLRQAAAALDLAEQQAELRGDLASLSDTLRGTPDALPKLEEALASAEQARRHLFDSDRDAALAAQEQVGERLEQLAALVEEAAARDMAGRSADQLADDARQIEQAGDQARQAAELLEQADQQASDQPAAAMEHARRAAEALRAAAERQLPTEASTRLDDAARAADDATREMSDASAEAAARRTDAAQAARAATDAALAALDDAIDDARRGALASQVGEWARGAEALQRAAAAERQIAQAAAQAAATGFEREQAAELLAEQAVASAVARDLAKAAVDQFPEIASLLEQAAKSGDNVEQQLSAAADPAVAPPPETADHVARHAGEAEAGLNAAARQMRDQAAMAAADLARQARQQRAATAARQQAAEQAPPLADAAAEEARQQRLAHLATRERQSRRDEAVAQAAGQAAADQQSAIEDIAAGRGVLESMPAATSSDYDEEAEWIAAERLADAVARFAASGRAIGQAVEELARQREIANPSLRAALDRASALGRLSSGEDFRDSAASRAMGTRFVPHSPEFTARMLAGRAAAARMDALLPPRDGTGGESSPADDSADPGQTADGVESQPNPTTSAAAQSASPTSGDTAADPRTSDDQPQDGISGPDAGRRDRAASAAMDGTDAPDAPPASREAPWFARLPPELRQAIRANSQRRAPRGYEERLKRYFQSLE